MNLSRVPAFAGVNCVLAGVYMARQSIRQIGADAFKNAPAFKNVPSRRLVLSFNDLHDRLHADAFRGNLSEILRELYLGACRLRSLPVGLLDNMSNLVVLQLWHNHIRHIPAGLFTSCCFLTTI